MNHRLLQRTLFRMQLDPSFAAAVLAGESEATASTDLDAGELEVLRRAPLAGITADPQDRRRHQVLGNIASEYSLSVPATAAALGPELMVRFLASEELHCAIAKDERLPLAFGTYLETKVVESDPRLRGLVELEVALCHLRREDIERPRVGADEVVLSRRAQLLELSGGTWAYAEAVLAGASSGQVTPPEGAPPAGKDWVLARAAPASSPGELREVTTEPLQPLVAELLQEARRPWGRVGREVFAREHDIDVADVDSFVQDLLDEGTLSGF